MPAWRWQSERVLPLALFADLSSFTITIDIIIIIIIVTACVGFSFA